MKKLILAALLMLATCCTVSHVKDSTPTLKDIAFNSVCRLGIDFNGDEKIDIHGTGTIIYSTKSIIGDEYYNYVLTAKHLTEGTDILTNTFYVDFLQNNNGVVEDIFKRADSTYRIRYTAFEKFEHPDLDIAIVIFTSESKMPFVQLSKSNPNAYEDIDIIGYPLGIGPYYSSGFVNVTSPSLSYVTSNVTGGSSGGPALRNGKVVGVVIATEGEYLMGALVLTRVHFMVTVVNVEAFLPWAKEKLALL